MIVCVAVILTVPDATPFTVRTLPFCVVVTSVPVGVIPSAPGWFSTLNVTGLLFKSSSVTSAFKSNESPILTVALVVLRPNPSMTTKSYFNWYGRPYTVYNSSCVLVAIIVAFPAPIAVTRPVVASTWSTELEVVDHVTSDGFAVVVSCIWSPTLRLVTLLPIFLNGTTTLISSFVSATSLPSVSCEYIPADTLDTPAWTPRRLPAVYVQTSLSSLLNVTPEVAGYIILEGTSSCMKSLYSVLSRTIYLFTPFEGVIEDVCIKWSWSFALPCPSRKWILPVTLNILTSASSFSGLSVVRT